MPYFISPKVLFGKGALKRLGPEIKGQGTKAVLIQKIRELEQEIGEPLSLKEAGITEQQMSKGIDTLVRLGSSDPNMGTIPCECREENLRQLFQDMWEGKR